MHVILIGYRCAGKTTVGKLVAERLGMRSFDTDKLVEAKARRSIAKIFEEDGEGAFRNLESEVIDEICGGDGKVISVGGGAVVRTRNVNHLKKCGRIYYLKVTPEVVKARLAKDPNSAGSRPALTRDHVLEEARDMMSRREPFYREICEATIDAATGSPEEIAEEIILLFGQRPPKKDKDDTKGSRRRELRESTKVKKKALDRADPDSVGLFPREK